MSAISKPSVSNLSIILCRQVPAIVPFGNSLKGFG